MLNVFSNSHRQITRVAVVCVAAASLISSEADAGSRRSRPYGHEYAGTPPSTSPVPPPTRGAQLDLATYSRDGDVIVGGQFGQTPQSLYGRTGVDVDTRYLGSTRAGPCEGRASFAPNHIVTLTDFYADFTMSVASNYDLGLVIHGPDGWTCVDDARQTAPAITQTWAPGTYRVWVTTLDSRPHDYDLWFGDERTPLPPPVPVAEDRPRLDVGSVEPTYDSPIVGAFEASDGVTVNGRTGGSVDASYLATSESGDCRGFVRAEPDHMVTLTERFSDLRVIAESSSVVSLIIHGPHGWRCAVPNGSRAAEISGSYPPGTYRVWIGSREPASRAAYALKILGPTIARPPVEPPLPPPPPPIAERWNFEGEIEELPMRFEGNSQDDVVRQCQQFASAVNNSWIDEIKIFGETVENSSGYWDATDVCSIVALNLRSNVCEPSVSGNVEGIPFRIHGDSQQVTTIFQRHYSNLIDMMGVDEAVINGVAYENSSSYWSAAQMAAIVGNTVVPLHAGRVVRGTIEQTPFVFTGNTADEIRTSCTSFVSQVMGNNNMIDEFVANGVERENRSGYWSATELCMAISAM